MIGGFIGKAIGEPLGTVAIVVETNRHVIASFKPARINVLLSLRQHAAFEPPVVETNVHFLATFRPTKITVLRSLRQNPDIEPPVVETNVHFLAKFTPTRITVP